MDAFVDPTDCALASLLALPQCKARNRAELERAGQKLRAPAESRDLDDAPAAYAVVDRQGRMIRMNATAARLLRVEPGRLPSLFLGTRLAAENAHVLLDSVARVLSTGEEETVEVGLGRPPEPQRDLRLVIRRENRRRARVPPTACRILFSESAEMAPARAADAVRQGFLQSVIDGIADPVLVIGTDHRVLFMNGAARAAAGEPAGPVAGRLCYRIACGRDTPCDRCLARAVLADGAVAKEIHRRPGADGQTRWIEAVGAPLRGPAGEVLGVIETFHDITEHVTLTERLKGRERELTRLATHDPLTGLPNRALFGDLLEQTLRLAEREHRHAALLFVDLDRFKSVNDSLGHAAGDQLLIQAARRMRAVVRTSDTVARLGGDEFAVVLGALEQADDAGMVARKLVEAFEQPFAVDGRMLSVTASIGIGLFPQDGTDVDALLRHADAAMYRAKSRGRDTFRYYTKRIAEPFLDSVYPQGALAKAPRIRRDLP